MRRFAPLAALFVLAGCADRDHRTARMVEQELPEEELSAAPEDARADELARSMRRLFTDRAAWMRQSIVSTLAEMPDAPVVSKRLLRNAEEIGDALVPYYDEKTGLRFENLLKEHVMIVDALTKALRDDHVIGQKEAEERAYDNASNIARILSGVNPNWSAEKLLAMFNEHFSLTTLVIRARVSRDWEEDVKRTDELLGHAAAMADAFSEGIREQFPERFGEATAR